MRNDPQINTCIMCGTRAVPFFDLPYVPINVSQLFFDSKAASEAEMGRLALAFCPSCGGIFNSAWSPAAVSYDDGYENSLDSSAVFNEYAEALACRLAAAYPLEDKTIVEVGCGQAGFLRRLCSVSRGIGIGFDPSYVGDISEQRIRIHNRLFNPADAAGASLIVCRHVLEHLPDPREFIGALAKVANGNKGTILYFEVPNGAAVFEGGIPWDLIYPHISYFTTESLGRLFIEAGFTILAAGTAYSDQFLYVEATTGRRPSIFEARDAPKIETLTTPFSNLLDSMVQSWADLLMRAKSSGKRVTFWGAGAKGVTFLNTVPGAREIASVVDINVRKQGSFIPGTGQPVASPESLQAFQPEIVILSNPIYISEINETLAGLHLHPAVIGGPESVVQNV